MERAVSTRSVAQLTAIIDSLPTAIIMVDELGHIELANAQPSAYLDLQPPSSMAS